MSVRYESADDAITFVITWNEFYHNTKPERISNIHTRYIFQSFFRENIGDFTELHNEKKNKFYKRGSPTGYYRTYGSQ